MNNTITFRPATRTDAPELLILNNLFNGNGCNPLQAIETSHCNNGQEIVCVAAGENRLVGFCCGQIFKSMCYSDHYGEITELYVLEAYRFKVLPSSSLGLWKVSLENKESTVTNILTGKSNESAQAFYRKKGYIESTEMMYRKRPRKT